MSNGTLHAPVYANNNVPLERIGDTVVAVFRSARFVHLRDCQPPVSVGTTLPDAVRELTSALDEWLG